VKTWKGDQDWTLTVTPADQALIEGYKIERKDAGRVLLKA